MGARGSGAGAAFIAELLGDPDWRAQIPAERLELLAVSLADGLVDLVSVLDARADGRAGGVFGALAALICAYAEECGPILPQLSRRSTSALNRLLEKIFGADEHELLFTAALAAYGAYGLARDAGSAAACFESGVFDAV